MNPKKRQLICLKSTLTSLLFLMTLLTKGQTNRFPPVGYAGIGTTSPAKPLEVIVPTDSSHYSIINVKNMDYTFSVDRYNQAIPVIPTIGIDDNYGLTWYNDGYSVGTAMVAGQKIVTNIISTTDFKILRLNAADNNLGNFSLELKNNGPALLNPSNLWFGKPNTSNITAWNKPLNLGSLGSSLRLYADGGSPNKIADVFIYDSRVGIGTETPNTNAKLDVNGNIFTNGKLVIGTTDAAQYGTYALAVNGNAIANKIKVKLYGSWPDYVFNNNYELPSLQYIEQYVKKHKHLPGVPSAADVEKEGIDIGDLQQTLLKKIEEITLHMIELSKKEEALSKKVEILSKENQELKQQLQQR